MNVRRVLRIGAVAAWALALVPAVPQTFAAATSSGAQLDAQGWWNRSQALPVEGNPSGVDDPTGLGLTTAPTVPAPPTVPEDGLYVANDATGASAVAAVRYVLDGQAGGTLTLRLADGAALTGTEEIVACPVLGGWEAAQNGRWDAKPGYDEESCTITAAPTAESDGLTFDVPASFASVLGDVSVVVTPAPGSATPFTLAFQAPTDGDFVVTTPVAPASPVATPSARPATATAPSLGAAPARSGFSTPAAPAAASPRTETAADEVAAPAVPVAAAPAADLPEPSRASQVAAVALLVAIGGALWWLASRPQRAPRLLGSVGGAAAVAVDAEPVVAREARPRGVGRFARPRTAPATRL